MKIKDLIDAVLILRKAKSAIIVTDSLRVFPVGSEIFCDETMMKLNDYIMLFHLPLNLNIMTQEVQIQILKDIIKVLTNSYTIDEALDKSLQTIREEKEKVYQEELPYTAYEKLEVYVENLKKDLK